MRRYCWLALICTVNAMATNFTVKAAGGGDFTTIQACATAMAAGDICTVYAGSYSESVSVPAGTVGNYKTLNVNSSDVVSVLGFTLGSHTKVIGNCTAPAANGSCGFNITNPSSPTSTGVSIGSSTDVFLTNNELYAVGAINIAAGGTDIYIQGNTFTYPGRTSSSGTSADAVINQGSHVLIEKNDFSHYRLGVNCFCSYTVTRGNAFHDQVESDSGQHTDMWFSEPDGAHVDSAQYNMVENNTHINATGPNAKGILAQGDACAGNCFNLIIRFNIAAHIDGTFITNDNAGNSSVNPGFHHVKSYNNTWVDTRRLGYTGLFTDIYNNHSINPADLNNIFYYPASVSSFNPYASDSTTDSTFSYGHGLFFCTGTCSSIFGHLYNSGSFASDPGNVSADPLFNNYATNDFTLKIGSPALNAGTSLTTVAAGDSGSGTSLVVTDAAYFQDGLGLTGVGVQADCISITTVGSHVCVTAVNYATNTLTMASSFSRSVGDSVWLYSDSTGRQVLVGNAPHIGATFAAATGGGSAASGALTVSGAAVIR